MNKSSIFIVAMMALMAFSCSKPLMTEEVTTAAEGDEYEDTAEFLNPQIDPDQHAAKSGVQRTYLFKFISAAESRVLHEKNSELVVKPASTMKLFTGWWSFQKKTRTQSYLATMLKKSNNAMASSIFRQMGGKNSISNYYKNIGLPVSEQNFVSIDGSGLSYSNKTNCKVEVSLLEYIYKNSGYSTFKKLLAQPGSVGTLNHRLTSLKGKVFAKTGTLKSTISLSGFLEVPNKGTVLFCVLSDYLNVSNNSERNRIDNMIVSVYQEVLNSSNRLASAN